MEKDAKKLRSARFRPLIAAIIGLGTGISLLLFLGARHWEWERIEADFHQHSENRISAIKYELQEKLEYIHVLRALLTSRSEVPFNEFQLLARELVGDDASIKAMEWIPRVPRNQRERMEQAARLWQIADPTRRKAYAQYQITERAPDGRIIRAAQREEYFPVYYVEPWAGNEAAVGFDLASEPMRRDAMTRARETGKMAASSRIELVEESSPHCGFLVFLPVYAASAETSDSETIHNQSPRGFVLGVFDSDDLLESCMRRFERVGIDIFMVEAPAPESENDLCCHWSSQSRTSCEETFAFSSVRKGLYREMELLVADRKWLLFLKPMPYFIANRRTWTPVGLLIGGLVLTALLAAYLGGLARRAERIAALVSGLTQEATARKQTEQKLRESEQRFQQVSQNAGEWIWETDRNGLYTYSSPAVEKILGYCPEEIIGQKHFYDSFAPPINESLNKHALKVLERKESFQRVLHPQVTKDGRIILLESSGSPFLDEEGNLSGYRGLHMEVTEREQVEQKLRESEKKHRILFESSQDAIMILEPPSWRFTSGNPAAVKMLGTKNEEELIALGAWDVSPEWQPDGRASAEKAREMIETTLHEGSHLFEWLHRRIGGEEFPADVLLTRMESGGKVAIQATVRDITERKRTEGQQERIHTEYRMILNSLGEGVHWVNIAGEIKFENPASAEMLGYEISELIGKPAHEMMHHTHADGAPYPARDCLVYATSKDGLVRHVKDEVFWRKDGTSFPVEYVCAPVRDEKGCLAGSVVAFTDVTERKRAEEALRNAEIRYRLLFEQSPDGIVILDPETARLLEFNETAHRQLGYSREEFARLRISDIEAAETPEDTQARIANVIHEGRNDFETRHRTRQGEIRNVYVTAQSIDILGRPVYHCIWRDITDRKRAEEALRSSQQILEGIMNTIPVRVFWKDENLAYLGCNKAFARDAGYADPKDLIGKDDYQLVWRDQAELYRGDDRHVIESGCPKQLIEEPQTTPDGKTITLLTSKMPLRSSEGKVIGVLGTYLDITDRKQAEESLRQSSQTQEVLNSLLRLSMEDLSLEAILERALDSILAIPWLVLESRGAIFLVEEDPAILVMKAQRNLSPQIQAACARVPFGKCICGRAAATGRIEFASHMDERHEIQYPGIILHGHYCVPLVSGGKTLGVINLYVKEGHARSSREEVFLEAAVSVLVGIIQRKRAEQERRELEEQMRQDQKLKSIGTLAGGIGHEISNPVMSIINYAQLISDRLPPDSREGEFAREIMQESQRISAIVNNLRIFSSQEKQHHSPARMTDIAAAALSLIGAALRHDSIRIEVSIPDDLPKVSCRSQQIQHILLNLIGNARDALNRRYPNFDPDKQLRIVSTKIEKEGRRWLRTTVEDHGGGIPDETRDHIFDPFFTTKSRSEAPGLGLSLSYGIAQEHDGDLTVEVQAGQFTRFHLDLPIEEASDGTNPGGG